MLVVHDLAFGYGSRIVGRGVAFSLGAGETLAVLGGNGCGKTTLFRTLLGLLPPLAGSVTIAGEDIARMSVGARARRLAYVPQQQTAGFAFTVEEAVLMGRVANIGWFAQPRARDRSAVNDALDRVGITHLAHRPITEISGGERQLALIARALAQGADILVLDEPTANLDYGNKLRGVARARTVARRRAHDPVFDARSGPRPCARRSCAAAGERSDVGARRRGRRANG